MKTRFVATAMLLNLAVMAPATGLFGIASGFNGYNFVKINPATGSATVLANIGYNTASAINSMAYDPVNHLYIAVAQYGTNSSQFIFINPLDWSTWSTDLNIPAPFFEGVEWMTGWPSPLVVSTGSQNYTQYLTFFNSNHVYTGFTLSSVPGNFDMDAIFRDGGNNLNQLDVNNATDQSPRHIIVNPLSQNWSWIMVGNWAAYTQTELDGAYDPVLQKLFVSRGNNLAYYNAAGTTLTDLPSYGGPQVGALAYGAEKATITGTIILDDTVNSFAFGSQRDINYALKQGTVTAWSGSLIATTQSVSFSIDIPSDIAGPHVFEWDTGSHLVKKLIVVLPGYSTGFGTVHLTNGDADQSGEVDAADIDEVIANFGNSYPDDPGNLNADVDVSGEVDAADIDIVIANFGATDE